MRLIGYTRVSTSKQGLSLEAQEQKLRAWATLHEHTLVTVVQDPGVSGGTLDRPGLNYALELLRTADGLVVSSLDRLARSVTGLGALLDGYLMDRELVSVSESIDTKSAAGRLVLNVLSSVSAWERERIAERTKAALQAKKAKGGYVGGRPPIGFQLHDGELVPDQAERAAAKRARTLRAKGLSMGQIAHDLYKGGYMARGDRMPNRDHVRSLLNADLP